jgi:hypothetical protein
VRKPQLLNMPHWRNAIQPAVFAAELGRALIPDLKARAADIEMFNQHQTPRLMQAQLLSMSASATAQAISGLVARHTAQQ